MAIGHYGDWKFRRERNIMVARHRAVKYQPKLWLHTQYLLTTRERPVMLEVRNTSRVKGPGMEEPSLMTLLMMLPIMLLHRDFAMQAV